MNFNDSDTVVDCTWNAIARALPAFEIEADDPIRCSCAGAGPLLAERFS